MYSIMNRLSPMSPQQAREGQIVAPLTLIVPGVLNGSRGPLLYAKEETCLSTSAWNGVPIVVNHPTENGRPLSARDPSVLERYGIGYLTNARCEGGRLVADGVFGVDKTRGVDVRVLDSLVSGRPIELSTGLHVDTEARRGTYNGRAYEAVARNYRPDHLAILPDSEGACSLADGCGVYNTSEDADLLPLPPPLIPAVGNPALAPDMPLPLPTLNFEPPGSPLGAFYYRTDGPPPDHEHIPGNRGLVNPVYGVDGVTREAEEDERRREEEDKRQRRLVAEENARRLGASDDDLLLPPRLVEWER